MSDLITHQPRLSEDQDLDKAAPPAPKSRYYEFDAANDLLIRQAFSLAYPETRALLSDPAIIRPVCPDEFVGTDLVPESFTEGKAVPNATMPEASCPESILGGEFRNTGNAFDRFLERLRQLCRNYNHDLYHLRQDLFRKKFKTGSFDLPPKIAAFRRSADNLSKYLASYDPRLPGNNKKFVDLAVEFVKINEYIASVRAGCSEPSEDGGDSEEAQYSSSSHVSISSMFSSYSSP